MPSSEDFFIEGFSISIRNSSLLLYVAARFTSSLRFDNYSRNCSNCGSDGISSRDRPRAKGDCLAEREGGRSHILGRFKELHFTLRTLRKFFRAFSCSTERHREPKHNKAPARPVTHHRQNDLRNHGETCSFRDGGADAGGNLAVPGALDQFESDCVIHHFPLGVF